MIARLAAWWAIKSASSAFLPIVIGLIATAIVSTVGGAFLYVRALQSDRDAAVADAQREKLRADIAQQSTALLTEHQTMTANKMREFGVRAISLDAQWSDLLNQSFGIPDDNAIKAAADLNRLGADARRLLEGASRVR